MKTLIEREADRLLGKLLEFVPDSRNHVDNPSEYSIRQANRKFEVKFKAQGTIQNYDALIKLLDADNGEDGNWDELISVDMLNSGLRATSTEDDAQYLQHKIRSAGFTDIVRR